MKYISIAIISCFFFASSWGWARGTSLSTSTIEQGVKAFGGTATNLTARDIYVTGGQADNFTINPTTHGYAWAEPFIAGLEGYEANAAGGTAWKTQGHANWNVFQTMVSENPTELQVYSSASQGIAQTVSGTNQVTLVTGNAFRSSWIGRIGFYWEGKKYLVSSVLDGRHLTVTSLDGKIVSWPNTASGTYFFVSTTVDNMCSISGSKITYRSGQPFIPFFDTVSVNGRQYGASFVDPAHMNINANLGTIATARCHQDKNIADELTNLRLQSMSGANEENFVITETPSGPVAQTTYAGKGKYRSIKFANGEMPAGVTNIMMELFPNPTIGKGGLVALGGGYENNEIARFEAEERRSDYWDFAGGVSKNGSTGQGLVIAAQGLDTDIDAIIDPKGRGNLETSNAIVPGAGVIYPTFVYVKLPASPVGGQVVNCSDCSIKGNSNVLVKYNENKSAWTGLQGEAISH